MLVDVFDMGGNNLAFYYRINLVRSYMAYDIYNPFDVMGNPKISEQINTATINKKRQRINRCFWS